MHWFTEWDDLKGLEEAWVKKKKHNNKLSTQWHTGLTTNKTHATSCCNLSCIPVSAPGDMTGCTDAQEVAAGDSSAAPRFFFYLSLSITGRTTSKLSPTRKKKLVQPHSASHRAAQYNFQAFQHSRLWQQTTAVLRPKTAAQTHISWKEKATLFVPNTWTHVRHEHIWSLHFTQPPAAPHTTPVYSTQQHPALTFKDVCTEAVEDEDQVLLDDHILLFSFTNSASTLHSRLSLASFLSFCLFSSGVDLSRWTAQLRTDRSYIDELYLFPEKSLCMFSQIRGQWIL